MLYNENDAYPAAWLRNLIAAGHLPDGTVDERSIVDLQPEDCHETSHFFAGIGGWPLALRQAGWTGPVWTGSCPCQPFSVAGKRGGTGDPRHLWPEWFRLIRECRPPVVFGEQVASRDGLAWLDLVQSDLEGEGYAVGALDLCAAGFGAPHIRQRLYFVAYSQIVNRRGYSENGSDGPGGEGRTISGKGSPVGLVADASWDSIEWLPCTDGKARPTQSGLFPLVDGFSFRLADGRSIKGPPRAALLRGIGNAIVPPLAAEFVKAYMELG